MRPLVALDWGSSSLRVARLDANGVALEVRSFERGILHVPERGFPKVFDAACGDWMRESGALALISGMAGSRQGWMEAPYCPCPASLEDVAARVAWVERGRIAIVPGLSCEHSGVPDVMRGEETQVFGALHMLKQSSATLVLPGTHSKWVHVSNGRIQSFATFMTGEFYALLRRHSILSRTLPAEDGELDGAAFLRGVAQARSERNLLRVAFSARTLSLFSRLKEHEGPSYLSGLLVGEELRGAPLEGLEPVVIVGSGPLTRRYQLALRDAGHPCESPGEAATWHGLAAIAQRLEAK